MMQDAAAAAAGVMTSASRLIYSTPWLRSHLFISDCLSQYVETFFTFTVCLKFCKIIWKEM